MFNLQTWWNEWSAWWVAFIVGLLSLFGLAGCAQNTETAQDTTQKTAATTGTEQLQAAQTPKRQTLQVFLVTGKRGFFSDHDNGWSEDTSGLTANTTAVVATDEELPRDDHATYSISFGNVEFTEGGATTPSITGTAEAAATGTQTASQTVTPTQDIKPEIGISLAFALQGQGVVDQAVSTAVAAGTSTLDKEAAHEAWQSMIESGDPEAIKAGIGMLVQVMADLQAAADKQAAARPVVPPTP